MSNLIHAISPQIETSNTRKLLVVDDSALQRKLITVSLKKWGYDIREASSGREALNMVREEMPDLIISDWMMPDIDGLEFCRELRKIDHETYVYFILLTSKSEKEDVAHGLKIGADDFLSKPVNLEELRARMSAGERILEMQKQLTEKNRIISSTLDELQSLYDALDKDLIEAKKLQHSLVKDRHKSFGNVTASLLLQSSGHVGGDLVSYFQIDETNVGFFAIDVSGHGISSALMTARLAGFFSGTTPEHNIALDFGSDGEIVSVPPREVATKLNHLVLNEMDTDHYFTLLLAYVDLTTGHVEMCQAGQPFPIIQRGNGRTERVGAGGMPIGLIPDISFEDFEFDLNSGDRFFMWSDGVTECPDPNGSMLDDDGAERLVQKNKNLSGKQFLEALMWDLNRFAGGSDFPDDISAIVVEYHPRKNST